MKKKYFYLVTVLMVIIILIIFINVKQSSSTKNEDLIEISVNDINDAMSQQKSMFILYGNDLCGNCQSIKKFLINKFDVQICYLNSDKIDENNFLDENKIKKEPSIIVIKEGILQIYEENLTEDFISQLIKNFMKEEIVFERFEEIIDIDYDSLIKRMDGNYDFFLYIGRPDCPDCEMFLPILQNYIKDRPYVGMYYLNIKDYRDASIQEDSTEQSIDFYEKLKTRFDIEWVPSVYHIQKGKIMSKYQFLNSDYYDLSNNEKERMVNDYKEELVTWIKNEFGY